MSIEEFLAEIFVDFYEQQMLAEGSVSSSEEFDELFYDDDGEQMSDIEFVETYCDDINTEELVDGVYYYLIDDGCDFDFSIKMIVSHFVVNFLYENYGDKDAAPIIRYLKNTDIKSVIELFVTNEHFGKSFIASYLKHYNDDIDYDDVTDDMRENNDGDLIDKWNMLVGDYCSLNEMLRRVFSGLYDHYTLNGYDDIGALNATWAYFTNNFDPIGELDKMGIDFESKQKYKAYMLRIMYSDLYEDICNGPIIDSVNLYDKVTENFVVTATNYNMCRIPHDEQVRNRMLKHFVLLHYEKRKRMDNRKVTVKEGRAPVLKKYHPGYILDTIDFEKK